MVNKLRWISWMGHVAHMREIRNAYEIFVVRLEWRRHIENLGILQG